MCLLAFACRMHPDYPLILVGNRDEVYDRPTAPLARWDGEPIYGGRDLQEGGSWLALHANGRLAALTNVRQLPDPVTGGPSRGSLVAAFVRGDEAPDHFLARTITTPCRGFNLLVGTPQQLWYGSNRLQQPPLAVAPGVHGLSNGFLDTPWPKTCRLTQRLKTWLNRGQFDDWPWLLDQLHDTTPAADSDLPRTGVPLELERALSPNFIRTESYGTRSSMLVRIDREGRAFWVERRYNRTGETTEETLMNLQLSAEGETW